MEPRFVLAYAVRKSAATSVMNSGSILMVQHPERGWEFPGGHIEDGETPEQALHREMKEEVGGIGELIAWNKTYYPNGWVGFVVVDDEDFPSMNIHGQSVMTMFQSFSGLRTCLILPIGMSKSCRS